MKILLPLLAILAGSVAAKAAPFLELSGGLAYPVLDGSPDDQLEPSFSARAGAGAAIPTSESVDILLAGYYALDRFSIVEETKYAKKEVALMPHILELEGSVRWKPSPDLGLGLLGGLQFDIPVGGGYEATQSCLEGGYEAGCERKSFEGDIEDESSLKPANFLAVRMGIQYIVSDNSAVHLSWYLPLSAYSDEDASIAINRFLLGASFGL